MKNLKNILGLILTIITLASTTAYALEQKIKFNKDTYTLKDYTERPNEYEYFTNGETPENWHSKITLSNHPNLTNETEAAAEYAHKIQEQTPGASVLVLPDVAMAEYITFPTTRDYYEYNALIFKPSKTKGLDMFKFSKRFYAAELNGTEEARKKAIDFAQENSAKHMEILDKTAHKYSID